MAHIVATLGYLPPPNPKLCNTNRLLLLGCMRGVSKNQRPGRLHNFTLGFRGLEFRGSGLGVHGLGV